MDRKKLEKLYIDSVDENKVLKEENRLLKELLGKVVNPFELHKYIEINIKNYKDKNVVKEKAIKKKKNTIKNITSSKEYKTFRESILKRDGYKCVMCGSDFRLQVHHIKPKSKYPELIMDKDNCITLCITCHSKTDSFLN